MVTAASVALAAAPLGGCVTARVNQFARFAEAGVAYAEAIDSLTLAAANAAIEADSSVLARTRPRLPDDEREPLRLRKREWFQEHAIDEIELGGLARNVLET